MPPRRPEHRDHVEDQGNSSDRGAEQSRRIARACEKCGIPNVDPDFVEGRLLVAEKINDSTVDLVLRLPPGVRLNADVARAVLSKFGKAVLAQIRSLRRWINGQQAISLLNIIPGVHIIGGLASHGVAGKEVERFGDVLRYVQAFQILSTSAGVDIGDLEERIRSARPGNNPIVSVLSIFIPGFSIGRFFQRSVVAHRTGKVRRGVKEGVSQVSPSDASELQQQIGREMEAAETRISAALEQLGGRGRAAA